jgi:hypothetical protein
LLTKEASYEDNFFDLGPGAHKAVALKARRTHPLTIRALNSEPVEVQLAIGAIRGSEYWRGSPGG